MILEQWVRPELYQLQTQRDMSLAACLHQGRVAAGALQVQGVLEAGCLRKELDRQLVVRGGSVVQNSAVVTVTHKYIHRLPALLLFLTELY